jgi:hypothetical protein
MRTAETCPTCSTFQDATCILYTGVYLSNIDANPGTDLNIILEGINTNLVPLTGTGAPDAPSSNPPTNINSPAPYVGQIYIDNASSLVYYAATSGTADDYDILITAPKTGAPEYSNNAAAVFAGLSIGQIYRTGDFLKIVHL